MKGLKINPIDLQDNPIELQEALEGLIEKELRFKVQVNLARNLGERMAVIELHSLWNKINVIKK